jgi:hypothetical protein
VRCLLHRRVSSVEGTWRDVVKTILRFNDSSHARLLAGITGDLVEVEEPKVVHPTLGHLCTLVGSVRDGGRTKLWLRIEDVFELTVNYAPARRPPPRKPQAEPPKRTPPPMRKK